MSLILMYITNSPEVAQIAQNSGVDRIWIDLQTFGKEERQKGMNTVKSQHTVDDIKKIKPILTKSEMLVRVNPWNDNSVQEIDQVVSAGADIIMLPMWKSAAEVTNFINSVGGRCKTTLLLETKEAVECLDEVLKNDGVDEIHIGLNDLHLSYGLTFMFELLANGTVEKLTKKIAGAGLPYGFGGIARLGEGLLPSKKVIMEHYRLGSTRAILSRSFCDNAIITDIKEVEHVFTENMKELRDYEGVVAENIESYEKNRIVVQQEVAKIVEIIRRKRNAD